MELFNYQQGITSRESIASAPPHTLTYYTQHVCFRTIFRVAAFRAASVQVIV